MTITGVERKRTYAITYCRDHGGLEFPIGLEDLDILAFAAVEGIVARPECPACGGFHGELRVVFPNSFTAATFGRGRNRMRQATATPGPIVEVYEPGAARGTIERRESPSTRFDVLRRARWGA